jgi:transcriptional regulator with XRE-family HTH domain
MHLVRDQEGTTYHGFYQNRRVLTRPDSLPCIFRKLRLHRNLTKRSLGEKFSVSERYVADVENGLKFPSLRYCLACGKLYDANPGWVKSKWAKEAIERYSSRLMKRLGLWP